MSRRRRPPYRPGLGWILGVAFGDTLTRPVRLAQGFTYVRCCGLPRASFPHGLAAPGPASHDGISLRAVASGSRLLPTRPAKDFHLQSSAHARHTYGRATPSLRPTRASSIQIDAQNHPDCRRGGEVAQEVITRPGRYQKVADNLEVKAVTVGDGERRRRYVVCYNPEEAARQK